MLPGDLRGEDDLFDGTSGEWGLPIVFLQGYGAPGNAQVVANLRRGRHAVVVASWLLDEAARHGCRAALTPPGLDRGIFYPGPASESREPVVSMMTSATDWKGTDDGLRALELASRDGVPFTTRLFGREDLGLPASDARPLVGPSREQVAALMRASAVFVCPSWEEGLGLPGLEAMACGAALATTDTRGSRDYARDGATAVVCPPREPAALGAAVIGLLREPRTRARLARAGLAHVHDSVRSWPQAAADFARAIDNLISGNDLVNGRPATAPRD